MYNALIALGALATLGAIWWMLRHPFMNTIFQPPHVEQPWKQPFIEPGSK